MKKIMNNLKNVTLIAALTVPTFASAAALTTEIGAYPGSSISPPQGVVTIDFDADTLTLKYQLSGMEKSATGGVHVHVGTSCDNAETVGGHYWTPTSEADTWNQVKWMSDTQGNAQGEFSLTTGYDYQGNLNHALVIHNSEGKRIGCGVLTAM